MDVDPESDQEDDDLRDDVPEETEHVVSEEDPDEPPYYGDVPTSPDTTVADEYTSWSLAFVLGSPCC